MIKDVIIIGAGAAGLMCAIEAGKRGRSVLVLDHANKVGKKILMSGGGRCNFTNLHVSPDKYLSSNKHFCKSALSRYTQQDFIKLVESYRIPYHEKTLGQLFCNNKAKDIVKLLLDECAQHNVDIQLEQHIEKFRQLDDGGFYIKTQSQDIKCQSLVIATGGLSIPTMGATGFGYELAQHFNLTVNPTTAGLVPFTLSDQQLHQLGSLSGISVDALVSCKQTSFRENILFTHRGLSGPAILQISSYWQPGDTIQIKLLPDIDLMAVLLENKNNKQKIINFLGQYFPDRMLATLLPDDLANTTLAASSKQQLQQVHRLFQDWQLIPAGTEGYRTAEVTLGGVDCNQLSSKTMVCKDVANLYFIGEVVDVTGWLGGYNFQWAWASGWAAGQVC